MSCYVIFFSDVPYITLAYGLTPWIAGVPSLPSIEPVQIASQTNRMSFTQRFNNLIQTAGFHLFMKYIYGEEMSIKYVPEKPPVVPYDLIKKSGNDTESQYMIGKKVTLFEMILGTIDGNVCALFIATV